MSSTPKPTLEDRLLHLHKSNGEKSDYVALLGKDGTAQGFYDLRKPGVREILEQQVAWINETEAEKSARWNREEAEREAKRFENATKVSAADWGGGVFWGDNWYASLDEFEETWEDVADEGPRPTYLWAAKPKSIRLKGAHDLWSDMMEQLDPVNEHDLNPKVESVKALDVALEAFYTANPVLGSFYAEDQTIAVVLPKETS